jgi:hypothetical protein
VQRHERHGARGVVDLVRGRYERHLREEVDERRARILAVEVTRLRDELLDVLGARLVLRVAAVAEGVDETRALEQEHEHVGHRLRALVGALGDAARRRHEHRGGLVEHAGEPEDGARDLRAEAERVGVAHRLAERDAVLLGEARERGLGGGPDAPLRRVQDAAECELVERFATEMRYAIASLISARS